MAEAREKLLRQVTDEGAKDLTCPCCDARAEMYAQSVGGPMVRLLAHMAARTDVGELINVPDLRIELGTHRGEKYSIMHLWDLIYTPPSKEEGMRRGHSGDWLVTAKGRRWLSGLDCIARQLWTFRGKVYAQKGYVRVWEVDKRFNYDEWKAQEYPGSGVRPPPKN